MLRSASPPPDQMPSTIAGIASADGSTRMTPTTRGRDSSPYRNLRHHAATRWFHHELDEEWQTVAMYLGDKLTTILEHYVRAGDEARKSTVDKLANY